MYTSVNDKEPWHKEGDVFLKIAETRFSYGLVKLHKNSDILSVYWSQKRNSVVVDTTVNDEFNNIDFRKVHLIDQKFSLGEVCYNSQNKLHGEVVGIHLNAIGHVYDSEYVIPGIPMELLKPEVIINRGKILLKGWLGEVKDKYWTIEVQDGDSIKYQKITTQEKSLPPCPYPKYFVPVVGRKMQPDAKSKKWEINYRQLSAVKVEWYHRLKYYPHEHSEQPPPAFIDNTKILKQLIEFDTNHFNECKKHVLCTYTIRETDEFLPLKSWENTVFDDMLNLDSSNLDCNIPKKKRKKDEFRLRTGDNVLVNVLRTFSTVDVEWMALSANGQRITENFQSRDLIHQNRLKYPQIGPFRQFVSVKEMYSNSNVSKTIGVTLCRNPSENTVFVQWLKEPGEKLEVVEESEFDLVPHWKFGVLHVGQLVERNSCCSQNDFIVGVIQDIVSNGQIKIEMGTTEKKEFIFSPDEVLVCPSISQFGAAKINLDLRKKDEKSSEVKSSSDTIPSLRSNHPDKYLKAITRDKMLMKKYQIRPHLGIIFQAVDYLDFCTAIIYGPESTPYEDGLFMFEFNFPYSYPNEPPVIKMVTPFKHSVSFHFGVDGQIVRKVNAVLSSFPSQLLWRADVTLEDLLLTLKNFIFDEEPFVHSYHDWELGMTEFDIERIKFHKKDSLKNYNAIILFEVFDSLIYLHSRSGSFTGPVWTNIIVSHLKTAIPKIRKRLKHWMVTPKPNLSKIPSNQPKFILFPISKGLKASMKLRIESPINL